MILQKVQFVLQGRLHIHSYKLICALDFIQRLK